MSKIINNLDLRKTQPAKQAVFATDYDPFGEGYRPMTGNTLQQRDFTPISQPLMLQLAYYLFDTSSIVKRYISDTKDFVWGDGVLFSVEEDEDGAAKQILDDFWDDPMNQMSLRMETRLEFFYLLGEMALPVMVNEHTGKVHVSYIDPENIQDVLLVKDFPETPAAIRLSGNTGRTGKTLNVIRHDTSALSKTSGRMIGDCFFWAINKPPNASRGRSELIALFDYIEGYEQGVFAELDRIQMIKAFIWDVEIEGGTDEQIREFLKSNATPKPGTVRAHNERIKWNAVAPTLNNADTKSFFDMMKQYISAGMNRPESWFGSGGKAYQTEADTMEAPTFKALASKQRRVKHMVKYILQFVLDQAIIHGTLPDKDYKIAVDMPPVKKKDAGSISTALNQLSQSLMLAEQNGWISQDTATRIYSASASQLGVDVDPEVEIENAEKAGPEMTPDYKEKATAEAQNESG